jgi:hypothetical protein
MEVQRTALRNKGQVESAVRVVVFATGEKAERLKDIGEGQVKRSIEAQRRHKANLHLD